MPLLTAKSLSLAFGWKPLLDNVSFSIEKGEKIALLGRNGEGKSTLLNVIRGAQQPDDGEIQFSEGVRVAYLPQDPPAADARTVREVIREGLANVFQALERYQQLSHDFNAEHAEEISALEAEINAANGWTVEQQIDSALAQFDLNGDAKMSELSGGWRRRVWLARVIVRSPEVLLLDEPTNHLDIGAIAWLEQFLNRFSGAVIFVTHDRLFMKNVANRIWELDRGRLLDVASDYSRFLKTREEMLHAEAEANTRFDKKLAEEEVWIRQGIKARRTRNEGRVRALKAMREERAKRIAQQGKATIRIDAGERSGKQVIVAENVSFAHPNAPKLITNFTDIVERGEKIGLIGANGVGKTTLLNVLLGKITPQTGEVRLGTNLEVAYFDQLRAQLDPNETLRESLGQGKDYVEINGNRKHIAAYLQDFLFPPERWNTPVSALSGGERARLMLARLLARPANVLVLDEPTNDLDIETLELLEEVLDEYPGTVLIVSHDRAFLDEVVTRSWVFNQVKEIIEQVPGGFADWLAQGGAIEQLEATTEQQSFINEKASEKDTALSSAAPEKANKPKLSYKYQRELEALPEEIDAAEMRLQTLHDEIAQADFHQRPHTQQADVYAQIEQVQAELDTLMERWLILEAGEV
ncbi:ATP-binding cassette domain-containing protein [Suttonella ornithocola]|uniref:ATP-binding protein Uup n=1 Tax=Suttonella ornithocola TaxID=279832 RepID=A0A380MVQ5_9GAMM|nr:ATP-binding cassette domain-containing protein [Suttonella ornithocola]SUO96378.1 Uncharacterized ABC transporter ATP-binding protein Rv2477c/MT2552 [Suttonella ornithocola]